MDHEIFTAEFKALVDEAIEKCGHYLSEPFNLENGLALEREMIGKFDTYIVDFQKNLRRSDEFFSMQKFGMPSEAQHGMTANIDVIKNRLIAFRANGYSNNKDFSQSSNGVIVNANLTANQTQTVNLTFDDVKHQIREMSGLSTKETEDTLEEIDKIQAIVELKEPKKTKWEKLKPILVWLADKSVDVGTALLPLILKIGENS